MKYSTVVQVAATVSAASAASADTVCPPAAVYVFEPQQDQLEQHGSSGTPQLTNQQTQLLMAEFVGTSSLYSAADVKDEFPADFIHKYISSLTNGLLADSRSSSNKPATAIVVVNGLPDARALFVQDKEEPAFEIKEAPSPSFFRAFLDRVSKDVEQVVKSSSAAKSVQQSADKAATVISDYAHKIEAAALKGLKDIGLISKRHMMMGDAMGHMANDDEDDDEESCGGVAGQRLKDDVARLEALMKNGLEAGEVALLRLESLDIMLQNRKYAEYYQNAVNKLSATIHKLADQVPSSDLRLMVIASPSDACTNKQVNLLKHACSPTSKLSKRSVSEQKASTLGPYKSVEACEVATKSCSGHGSCVKVGTALDGETSVYGCACAASYNEEKKQTTRYGGYACQKIDISVPTQMFLWSGVALLLTGIAGVKLLYSIDAEPLPGILNIGKRATTA